jgi:phospho-N-acetylmuramoyl-pentapeptide-transferase
MSKNVVYKQEQRQVETKYASVEEIYCNYDSVFKNNEFDYAEILAWTGEGYEKMGG